MLDHFDNHRTEATRALQAYLVLIGCAARQETLTYGQLANRMGIGGGGVLANTLGHIAHWCQDNELPILPVLVVNQKTWQPGDGYPRYRDIDEEKRDVFRHNWFLHFPPTPESMQDAFHRLHRT